MTPVHLDRWLDEEIARVHVRRAVDRDARDRQFECVFLLCMVLVCAAYLARCVLVDKAPSPAPPSRPSAKLLGGAGGSSRGGATYGGGDACGHTRESETRAARWPVTGADEAQLHTKGGPASLRAGVSTRGLRA